MLSNSELLTALNARDLDALLSGLPQRLHIDNDDAVQWLDAANALPRFECTYKAYRALHGIDATEAAVAVQMYAMSQSDPMHDPFASPRDLACRKLLQHPVAPPSRHAERAERFKPLIIDMFLEQVDGSRCPELEASCAQASGTVETHEWMQGAPDLIAKIGDRYFLVGIYAPENAADEYPFAHTATLHQLRELCRQAKVRLDGMLLASYDWVQHTVLPLAVPANKHITDALYRGGDLLWSHICHGTLPAREHFSAATPPLAATHQQQVAALEEKLLKLDALTNALNTQKTEAIGQLNSLLAHVPDLPNRAPESIGLSALSLNVQQSVDSDAVQRLLAQKNMRERLPDIRSLEDGGYDAARMAARLMALGEDVSRYRTLKLDPSKTASLLSHAGIPSAVLAGSHIVQQSIHPRLRADQPELLALYQSAGMAGVGAALEAAAAVLGDVSSTESADTDSEFTADEAIEPLQQSHGSEADVIHGSEIVEQEDNRSALDAFLVF
jgi:hypothetical protein